MFTIHGNRLPTLTSYAACVEFAKTAHKFDDNWFALVSKREPEKQLRLYGDYAALRYHETNVVTHFRDGKCYVRPFDSSSTVIFADRFLPGGIHARTFRGEMLVCNHEGQWRGSFLQFNADGTLLNKDETLPYIRTRTDRKAANAVRKKIAAFTEWFNVIERLKPSNYTNMSSTAVQARKHAIGMLLDAPDDHTIWSLVREALREAADPTDEILVASGARREVALPPGTLPPR